MPGGGHSRQSGRACHLLAEEVQITYHFALPPDSDAESDDSFMPGLKNGKTFVTPHDTPALTLVATVVK